jgi:hypothetical protein
LLQQQGLNGAHSLLGSNHAHAKALNSAGSGGIARRHTALSPGTPLDAQAAQTLQGRA